MKTFHYAFAPESKWVRCRDKACQENNPLLHVSQDNLKDALQYYTLNLSVMNHPNRASRQGLLVNLALVRHYLDNVASPQMTKTADYVEFIAALYPNSSEFWIDSATLAQVSASFNSLMGIYNESYSDTSPQGKNEILHADNPSYFSVMSIVRMAAKINQHLYMEKDIS